jgi:DNA (cytosine-5)-methyltransferase 1
MTLTVGSLFSGIEGIGLGFEQAGMEVLWRCEIDVKCRQLMEKKWPGVPVYDDVRTISGSTVARVDVLCGGFPCQDLSVAGARAGLAGERSGLFHEFMRIADEISPTWVVIENVPGLLSSNAGRDMGIVLGVLADLGYGWSYRVLDAQYFGVAQRRRRVFIVGHLGDPARAAQVLLEPESCDGDPPPSRQKGPGVAALTANGVGTCGADDNQAQAGHLIADLPDVSTTLEGQRGQRNNPAHETFLTELRVAAPLSTANGVESNSGGRRQEDDVNLVIGFAHQAGGGQTSSGAFVEDGSPTLQVSQTMAVAYTVCLGSDPISTSNDLAQPVTGRNGDPGVVAYPLAMRGRKDGAELEMGEEGVYNALRAGDGGSSRQNLVAYSTKLHNTTSNQAGKFYEDYTPSLQANSPPPAVAYALQDGRALDKAQNGLGIKDDGAAYTVDTLGAQAVAFSENQRGELLETDYSHQLTTGGGKPGQGYPAVRQDMAVRRLTPLECERLQGFPDEWTEGFADSTRYRMLGNAVCVPVARWIGLRIVRFN